MKQVKKELSYELNYPEAKEITIKELSQTLKNLSFRLDNEELEAVQCAIYLMNKHLNGSIYFDLETKIKVRTLIDKL
jgi:hypothetical protein